MIGEFKLFEIRSIAPEISRLSSLKTPHHLMGDINKKISVFRNDITKIPSLQERYRRQCESLRLPVETSQGSVQKLLEPGRSISRLSSLKNPHHLMVNINKNISSFRGDITKTPSLQELYRRQFEPLRLPVETSQGSVQKLLEPGRRSIPELSSLRKSQHLMGDMRKNISLFRDDITKIASLQEQHRRKLEPLHLSEEASQGSIHEALGTVRSFPKVVNELKQPMLRQQDEVRKLLEPFAKNQGLALSFAKEFRLPLMRDFVNPLSKLIDSIPEKLLRIKLNSQYWIVEDEDVIAYLTENRIPDADLGKYICEYYSADEWSKLNLIVEKWREHDSIRQRYFILKDCFKMLKSAQGENVNVGNAIIPALIAQIEGLKGEILNIPSDEFKEKIKRQLDCSLTPATDKQSKEIKRNDWEMLCLIIFEFFSERDVLIFYKVIGELFKNSYEFDEEKRNGENALNINRHKIQHGDGTLLDYGTKENTVRLFLYVDFIIKILIRVSNENNLIKSNSAA